MGKQRSDTRRGTMDRRTVIASAVAAPMAAATGVKA